MKFIIGKQPSYIASLIFKKSNDVKDKEQHFNDECKFVVSAKTFPNIEFLNITKKFGHISFSNYALGRAVYDASILDNDYFSITVRNRTSSGLFYITIRAK